MSDWAGETAELIEKTVGNVAAKLQVDRARSFARAVVYGMLVACFALTALALLLIVAFRVLVVAYNQLPAPHDNAWMAWLTLGALLCGGGAFVWSKRTPRSN